ncbi:unnamed protein product [Polarella glacialis]|uniref:Uncharacterized protein n=1 Tax=Polarella glacialis TaxID=89957 RepID=A0A813F062_POLGL|nr:unnamed protein product [Polarella glacialis]
MAKHILSFAFLFLLCQTGRASAVCEGDQSENGTCVNDDSDALAFVQAKIRRHPVAPSIDGNYTNKLAHVMIIALNGDMLPFANKTVCKAAYPFLLDAIVATEVNFSTSWGPRIPWYWAAMSSSTQRVLPTRTGSCQPGSASI